MVGGTGPPVKSKEGGAISRQEDKERRSTKGINVETPGNPDMTKMKREQRT